MKTEYITVKVEGKEYIIYRDEILGSSDDSSLKQTFVLCEATQHDCDEAQLRMHQLKHALSSMHNTLQQSAIEYIVKKHNIQSSDGQSSDGETVHEE